jgi:photosystem I reaction center subunit XII
MTTDQIIIGFFIVLVAVQLARVLGRSLNLL